MLATTSYLLPGPPRPCPDHVRAGLGDGKEKISDTVLVSSTQPAQRVSQDTAHYRSAQSPRWNTRQNITFKLLPRVSSEPASAPQLADFTDHAGLLPAFPVRAAIIVNPWLKLGSVC